MAIFALITKTNVKNIGKISKNLYLQYTCILNIKSNLKKI